MRYQQKFYEDVIKLPKECAQFGEGRFSHGTRASNMPVLSPFEEGRGEFFGGGGGSSSVALDYLAMFTY